MAPPVRLGRTPDAARQSFWTTAQKMRTAPHVEAPPRPTDHRIAVAVGRLLRRGDGPRCRDARRLLRLVHSHQ
jgi:hypothetical protein